MKLVLMEMETKKRAKVRVKEVCFFKGKDEAHQVHPSSEELGFSDF